MVVAKKRKMRRTQVSLTSEQLEAGRRMARERGVSLSQVVRDSLEHAQREERLRAARLFSIVGLVKGADPDGSESVDEAVYGTDIR